MAKQNQVCPYCDDRPIVHKNLDCCQVCYHWFWRWTKRGPAAILRRARQIETLDNRMKALLGMTKGLNEKVTHISTARKAKGKGKR